MPVVDLATARLHLRADSTTTEDSLIDLWLGVAEEQVAEFLNRNVYADGTALAAAKAAAPGLLQAASTAYIAALDAIVGVSEPTEYAAKRDYARSEYTKAVEDYHASMNGIVVNDTIRAAILLTLAYLYETRNPEATMPTSHRHLLYPYRVQVGV